ncbi:MAG: formylglycine-generating enzyme family protein [Pirellulales bacterium]
MCRDIESRGNGRFRFVDLGAGDDLLPTFHHTATNLDFKLVLGGRFRMGLSDAEESAARANYDPPPLNLDEMRPVRDLAVEAFFMSVSPILGREWLNLNGESAVDAPPDRPVFVTHEQATRFTIAFGCRLVSEAEWEYACRGGTSTLFFFGDKLPPDDALAAYVAPDYRKRDECGRNPFRLCGMFTGEFCADEYRRSLNPRERPIAGVHVVRGGGAFFWPWQDQEWVWCMSAMRMPSTDLVDGVCGFRLVHDL